MEDYKDQKKSPLDDKNGGVRKPRFSIYWIYAIVAIFLIGYQVMRGVTPDASDITELKFRQDMLSKNDVEKVEPVMNKNIVRVFIKKDSLNKQYYKDLLGERWVYASNSKDAPHFQFAYSKVEDYQQRLDDYFKANPEVNPVPVAPVSDPEWFGPFLNLLFPLLMFALLFVLMMRKVGGPGSSGGPGGIFNIGKSKAQLFDKGTKVNITFHDVAGISLDVQPCLRWGNFLDRFFLGVPSPKPRNF